MTATSRLVLRAALCVCVLALTPGCSERVAPPPVAETLLPQAAPARPASSESVYVLNAPLTDANGARVGFDVGKGHPTMIAMFYASCTSACPLMINSIKRIESKLTPEARADVRVVLISFDAEKDTPEALRSAVQRYQVDPARWTLGRTTKDKVREVAALFGIQYQQLEDGSYNHTSPVIVLDREGRPVTRLEALGDPEESIVEALSRLSASRSP